MHRPGHVKLCTVLHSFRFDPGSVQNQTTPAAQPRGLNDYDVACRGNMVVDVIAADLLSESN